MSAACKPSPILVRRYARTRLYDATNRCYVSVEQLCEWDTDGVAFQITDAETGADITRILLA